MKRDLFSILFLGLFGLVSSCSQGGSGSLQVYLKDAGIEGVSKALVKISNVSVHRSSSAGDDDNGWLTIPVKGVEEIDLLTLQNDVNVLLAEQSSLPAGSYQQLRIAVESARLILVDDSEVKLTVPSDKIKINLDVTIEADKKYGIMLDFSAEESFNKTGAGDWKMKPVIKVEDIYVINADGTHTSVRKDGGGFQPFPCTAAQTCSTADNQKCCAKEGTEVPWCVDFSSDVNNCGDCGIKCTAEQKCVNKACVAK